MGNDWSLVMSGCCWVAWFGWKGTCVDFASHSGHLLLLWLNVIWKNGNQTKLTT